jgi:hypothetical protein
MALHVSSLERIFFCFFVVFMCFCVIASWGHFFLWLEAPSSPPASASPSCYLIIAFVHTSPTCCLLASFAPVLPICCLSPACYTYLLHVAYLLVAHCLLLLPSLVMPTFACLLTSTIVTYLPPCLGVGTKHLFHYFTTYLFALSFKLSLLLGISPLLVCARDTT